ncbi:MAG TPA: sulfur carrier protein ThiS, partial [Longimicrobiales bacterium]|nr:sulfur carrier protein ThiS [Longimicrobiales bacterium]
VNGDPREFAAGSSIADLLRELGLNPRLVVVEHNREILDRKLLDDVRVSAGDVLELVHFVGGG